MALMKALPVSNQCVYSYAGYKRDEDVSTSLMHRGSVYECTASASGQGAESLVNVRFIPS